MKKTIILGCIILALSVPAAAQDLPLVNLFIGGHYLGVDTGVDTESALGVEAELNLNLNNSLGIFYNFGYSEALDVDAAVFTDLGGVRYFVRSDSGRGAFFVHVMGGGAEFDAGISGSAWALGGGAGYDLRINDRVSVRVFKVDYIATFFADDTQNHFRVSGGIVINFGQR